MDEATVAFVEGGKSIVLGTVGHDGLPQGSRAWGASVMDPEAMRVRLLVCTDDVDTMANLRPGAAIAITVSDVRTLLSLQLKGHVLGVQAASADDLDRRRRYLDEFLWEIHDTDGDALDKLERWADRPIAACLLEVDELFDQTPGPAAGTRVSGAR
jgi:hypothetical protein